MRWNHSCCTDCWVQDHSAGDLVDIPTRVIYDPGEWHPVPCCICGRATTSAIFIRRNPAVIACKGKCKN